MSSIGFMRELANGRRVLMEMERMDSVGFTQVSDRYSVSW